MAAINTPRLSIPFMAAGQAQKHVTFNEGIMQIDALVHLSLVEDGVQVPPAAPPEGAAYGIGITAVGAWAGQDGRTAIRRDGGWIFANPAKGWRAAIGPDAILHVHDGATWRAAAQREFGLLGRLGIGATADAANPVNIRSNSVLLDANPAAGPDSGDLRVKLNRVAATDICSLVWQTGYSGRAELGLSASDALELRMSANGSSFTGALAVSPDDAIVRMPTRPAFKARRSGADVIVSTAGALIPWNDPITNVGGCFDVANSRFVAPVAGVYAFSASVFANLAATRCIVDLVKNGATPLARGERADVGGAFDHFGFTTVETLQKNDGVDMRLALGSVRITAQHFTSFTGHLIG
jgi:hypothetical protein